jgi:hypothetical protein
MPSGGWGFRPIMGTLKIMRAINEKQYSTEIPVQSLFNLLVSNGDPHKKIIIDLLCCALALMNLIGE